MLVHKCLKIVRVTASKPGYVPKTQNELKTNIIKN